MKEKVKPERVAVTGSNSDMCRVVIDETKKAFGNKVVATEMYELLKQTDFSTLATRLTVSKPDAIVMGMIAPEQDGNLLRALKEAGVPGRRILSPGALVPDLVKVAGPSIEGAFCPDIWAPSSTTR